SATMPAEIRTLANSLLRQPAVVQVPPVAQTADGIDESAYFVEKRNKSQLLAHLVNELPMSRAIVFTRTKHGADKVVRNLHARGIRAEGDSRKQEQEPPPARPGKLPRQQNPRPRRHRYREP